MVIIAGVSRELMEFIVNTVRTRTGVFTKMLTRSYILAMLLTFAQNTKI